LSITADTCFLQQLLRQSVPDLFEICLAVLEMVYADMQMCTNIACAGDHCTLPDSCLLVPRNCRTYWHWEPRWRSRYGDWTPGSKTGKSHFDSW